MNAMEAKEFIASRIVDQARLEEVEFSELERKMLFYSEAHPSLPDMDKVVSEFDQTVNMPPYEKVVSSLISNAYRRDRKNTMLSQRWNEAEKALRWEDHYINVMLKRRLTSANRRRDFLIYIAVGIAVVFVIFGMAVWSH
jgi:hypothetical protein